MESLRSKRTVKPVILPFYLKGKERNGGVD